jgi:hypothetical protein
MFIPGAIAEAKYYFIEYAPLVVLLLLIVGIGIWWWHERSS